MTEIILLSSGKGGVGKTSTSSNLADQLAHRGNRVLVVDCDEQGDVATVFGTVGGESDAIEMMIRDKPWSVAQARPNLDIIPAGPDTATLIDFLRRAEQQGGMATLVEVARTLRKQMGEWDYVILDTPAAKDSTRVLIDTLVATADHLIIPTKSDPKSLKNVSGTLRRVVQINRDHPDAAVNILGVLLFDLESSAKSIRTDTREFLEGQLGEAVRVFDTVILHSTKADRDQGIGSQTAREYAAEAAEVETAYDAQKIMTKDEREALPKDERVTYMDVKSYASGAAKLAANYEAFTDEVLDTIANYEDLMTDAAAGGGER